MGLLRAKKLKEAPPVSYHMDDIVKNLRPQDRCHGTPTLEELDEMLTALTLIDRLNVYATRKQLKWAFKMAHKKMNMDLKNPWYQPKK